MNKTQQRKITSVKIIRILMIVAILCFVAGLLAFAYMGSFIRLIGDDYCYAGIERAYGFFGGQVQSYFHEAPYHGDRIMLTFVSFLISRLPPAVNGWIPFITIIFFCLANYYLTRSIARLLKKPFPVSLLVLLSIVLAFFTFLLAPTVKQSLYFRSAMLPSFAPLIFTFLLVGWLLRHEQAGWLQYLLVFLGALLNATLSENGAAFQAAALGLVLIYFIWKRIKIDHKDGSRVILTVLALAGTITGVIIMWLSPSITEQLVSVKSSVWDGVKMSLTHTLDTYLGYFKTYVLVIAVLLVTGGSAAVVVRTLDKVDENPHKKSGLKNLLVILIVQVASLVLVFSLMLPSAYTRGAYPDPRHLIGATLVMTANVLITGFCFTMMLFNLFSRQLHHVRLVLGFASATILLLIGLLYPVRYIPQITQERLLFQYWSQQWKRRDEKIVAAARAGEDAIHVMRLDHIIEDVAELGPDPITNWYNLCAAQYYGIEIFADQPGWEEGFNTFLNTHQ